MDLTLHDIEKFILAPLKDGEKEHLIMGLSTMFTQKRGKIGKYVLDERLVSAYTLYFVLSNMRKLDFLFSELSFDTVNALKNCTLVDFGCGPGTYGLAWWNFFDGEVKKIFEIDNSEIMLKQSKKLITGLTDADNFVWGNHSTLNLLPDGPTCLLFGNSMNEMSDESVLNLVNKLNAEFIIFIEPGTKEVFHRVRLLKEKFLEINYSVSYPCMTQGDCPMSGENWCHQVIRSTYSQDYESLCQRVKKDRRKQPASLYLFKRGKIVYEEDSACKSARFIQLLNETKFSFIFEICLDKSGENLIEKVEILKKRYKKKTVKELAKMEYGRKLFFEYVEERKDGHWIIELIGDSF